MIDISVVKFNEEEKREYEKLVLEKLRKGLSTNEISGQLNISCRSILRIVNRLKENGKITAEEINNLRNARKQREEDAINAIIIKGLREGKKYREIGAEVNIGEDGVSKIVKKLIAKSFITKEEIEDAKSKRKAREEAKLEETVYEYLKKGLNGKEIANELNIALETVYARISKLISDGKITREEIKKREKTRQKEKTEQGVKAEDKYKKTQMLYLLRKGETSRNIRKKLNIDAETFKRFKQELIKDGKINEYEIKEFLAKRKAKDDEMIVNLFLQGMSQNQIAKQLGQTQANIYLRLKRLEDEKKLSKAEIEEDLEEKKQNYANESVLTGLKQGKTIEKISMDSGISIWAVRKIKDNLLQDSIITQKEIDEARSQREPIKQKRRTIKNEKHDDNILQLLKMGFEQEQIAKILQIDVSYVRVRERSLIARKLLTRESIADSIEGREEKINKLKDQILDRIRNDKSQNDLTEFIGYYKAKLKLEDIKLDDVDILDKALTFDAKCLNLENINLVLRGYIKLDKIFLARQFIEMCLQIFKDDDEKRNTIIEAREKLDYYLKKQKVIKLISLGKYTEEDIAREVGLMTIDVIEIKREYNIAKQKDISEDERQNEEDR